jgi:hypothetical protein
MGVIVWLWKHLPNSAEMSRLASRSLDQPLSLGIRLEMLLHYFICVWCKRYFEQLRLLHKAAPQSEDYADTLPGHGLSVEARQRMVQHLQDVEKKTL